MLAHIGKTPPGEEPAVCQLLNDHVPKPSEWELCGRECKVGSFCSDEFQQGPPAGLVSAARMSGRV